MCIVSLAFNINSKVYDAHGRIVLESSTEKVRTWKESLATESEADVCSLDLEVTSSKLFHIYIVLHPLFQSSFLILHYKKPILYRSYTYKFGI